MNIMDGSFTKSVGTRVSLGAEPYRNGEGHKTQEEKMFHNPGTPIRDLGAREAKPRLQTITKR